MDKKMNHSLLTFYRSLLHGLFLNKKRHRLILFKGVIVTIIFIFPTLCNGSDQNPETLKQLIEMYDPTDCRECHEEIYAQWQNSRHARSISWIFMERYDGVLDFSKTNIHFEEREFDRKLANGHAELGFGKSAA
jgi:hypothetical protein